MSADETYEIDCECAGQYGCGNHLSVSVMGNGGGRALVSIDIKDGAFTAEEYESKWRAVRACVREAFRQAVAILRNKPVWHGVVLEHESTQKLVQVLNGGFKLSDFEICKRDYGPDEYDPEPCKCFENGGCPFLKYYPEVSNSNGYEAAFHECQMGFEEYWDCDCCLDSISFPIFHALFEAQVKDLKVIIRWARGEGYLMLATPETEANAEKYGDILKTLPGATKEQLAIVEAGLRGDYGRDQIYTSETDFWTVRTPRQPRVTGGESDVDVGDE